ncbi:hypothetical protein ACVDG5_015465 [Mesorhizobium sp. ORM6]
MSRTISKMRSSVLALAMVATEVVTLSSATLLPASSARSDHIA